MARRTKYTPETIKKIIDALKLGATYRLACGYAGISFETFNEWRRDKPEFSEQVSLAEGTGAIVWLAKIEKAASDGTWQAAAWKLERRYPEQYGRTVSDQRHKFDFRRDAEAIAAEIGKPELVDQIHQDLLLSQEATR